jgi:hypothetical protein
MNSNKAGLALGFELIGFFLAAYFLHAPVAEQFHWNPDRTLAGLSAFFFLVWLGHVAIYTSRQSE